MADLVTGESSLRAEIAAQRQRLRRLEAEVAELERTRELLRQEHSFREAVIERAAEGICVCHGIEDYPFVRFTVWNPRMTDITGYTKEEINQRGWYQTVYPDPEIQDRARNRMAEMREGEDLRNERWEITCADGSKKNVGISTSVLSTDDGLKHALALMLDVTDEERYREHLESHVERLEGILPICASCKQIRDDEGAWQTLEGYITDHSDAVFSHGVCPDCMKELYPHIGFKENPPTSGDA